MGNPKLYLVDKLCGKPDWSNEQEYTVCALVGFFNLLALSHTGSHIYVYLQINL